MALNIRTFDLISSVLSEYDSLSGLRMFELGNQIIDKQVFSVRFPAKYYFSRLGIEHISLDLNGRNGALKRDITDSVSDLGKFDIVTNFGCSEHVKADRQYLAFRNLYELCSIGGHIVHHAPMVGHWAGHGCVSYDEEFFRRLPGNHEHLTTSTHPVNDKVLIECVTRKIDDSFLQKGDFPKVWNTG